jgi:hypothetical protein
MRHPDYGILIKRRLRMGVTNMSVGNSFRMASSVKRKQRTHHFVSFIKTSFSAESI